MKKQHLLLNLTVKGRTKNVLSRALLQVKAFLLGVKLHKVRSISASHVEIVVGGQKNQLWEIIKWTKGRASVFIFLNEVTFEFVDPDSL